MSIQKVGKKYLVRWSEGGRHRGRRFDREQDAIEFERELIRMRQLGVDLAAEERRRATTVEDLVVLWLESHEPRLGDDAAVMYARQIEKRILPALGHRRVRELTVHHTEQWIANMLDDGDGLPTIRYAVAVLSKLLSIAVKDGIVAANVAQLADKPQAARERVPVLVSIEQIELMRFFLQAYSRHDVLLLDLLGYGGLRPWEALGSRWEQEREYSLIVRDSKGKRQRTLRTIEPLRLALQAERKAANPRPQDLIVPGPNGGEWNRSAWRNWRQRKFAPAAEYAGLPEHTRPRDLRGSFESMLVHEGQSIVDTTRQLGHAPDVALAHYLQAVDGAPELLRGVEEQVWLHRILLPFPSLGCTNLAQHPHPQEAK